MEEEGINKKARVDFIFDLTTTYHEEVTVIYELVSELEDSEAIKSIDTLIANLRVLKTNLIGKEKDEKQEL